jgi:hypothetical protein
LTINDHIAGCFDSYPNLVAVHGHHGDFDVIANANDLAYFAHQDQH